MVAARAAVPVSEQDGRGLRIRDIAWRSPTSIVVLHAVGRQLFQVRSVTVDGAPTGLDSLSLTLDGRITGLAGTPKPDETVYAVAPRPAVRPLRCPRPAPSRSTPASPTSATSADVHRLVRPRLRGRPGCRSARVGSTDARRRRGPDARRPVRGLRAPRPAAVRRLRRGRFPSEPRLAGRPRRRAGLAPPWAATAYDGVPRDLVLGLKEHRLLGLVRPLAALLAASVGRGRRRPGAADPLVLVPVPSRRASVRARGHDPTHAITARAADLLRRRGVRRQVGPAAAAAVRRGGPGRSRRRRRGRPTCPAR